MDIKDLEREVGDIFEVDTMGKRFVVRSKFFCSCDDSEGIILGVTPRDDGSISITDMCETYSKLYDNGIEIDGDQNKEKLERILKYSMVSFDDESKEFYTVALSINELSFSIIRLVQAVIVAGSADIFVK